MTHVYLDVALASASDAPGHIANLIDAGQRVTFVGPTPQAVMKAFPDVPSVDGLPGDPGRGSWFVTAEPARCAQRPVGVKTLLIGPRAGRSPIHGPRCDTEARDLAAAVLEILAHDAMGSS